jgi:hypothetical protein
VYHDLLGMMQHPHHAKVTPKFCKQYSAVGAVIQEVGRVNAALVPVPVLVLPGLAVAVALFLPACLATLPQILC